MTYVGMSPIDICLEVAAPWYNRNSSSNSSSSREREEKRVKGSPIGTCNSVRQHDISFGGICSTRENQSIGLRWSVVIPGVCRPFSSEDRELIVEETSSSSLWVGEGGLQAYMAQLLECGNWGEREREKRGGENELNFCILKCWQGERFVFIRYLVMTGIGGVEERGLDYEQ